MKYRLREGKSDVAIYDETLASMEGEIKNCVRKISLYRNSEEVKNLGVRGCIPTSSMD